MTSYVRGIDVSSGRPTSRKSKSKRGKVIEIETGVVEKRKSRKSKLEDSGGMLFERKYKAAVRSESPEEPEELGDTAVIDTGMAFVKVCVCECVCVRMCVSVTASDVSF